MKYLFYYDNVNRQRSIRIVNETFEQILIDGTVIVIEYLSSNTIPVDSLPILPSSTIPTIFSSSLSFTKLIDTLKKWKSLSYLI